MLNLSDLPEFKLISEIIFLARREEDVVFLKSRICKKYMSLLGIDIGDWKQYPSKPTRLPSLRGFGKKNAGGKEFYKSLAGKKEELWEEYKVCKNFRILAKKYGVSPSYLAHMFPPEDRGTKYLF